MKGSTADLIPSKCVKKVNFEFFAGNPNHNTCVCVCACVRACVRACVHACVCMLQLHACKCAIVIYVHVCVFIIYMYVYYVRVFGFWRLKRVLVAFIVPLFESASKKVLQTIYLG